MKQDGKSTAKAPTAVTFQFVPQARTPRKTSDTTRVRMADPKPGDVLNGRYRVERLLGQGGMGAVYLVSDSVRGGARVALKMLRSSELTEEQLALLKNEFETMARLEHPNLASVYDFEVLHGTDVHFLSMEYVEGVPLESAASDLKWQRLMDLVVQVCRALAYMHSRSVIHFDLKPANIMVTGDGKVKVLDFGLAGARAYQARKGELLVSPAYMAPDLALSASTADHRADLYSLGIILYQLLTGNLPFRGSTVSELLRAHCYTPMAFDEQIAQTIPAWLRRIVLRLCAKDPADRFRSANAVIEELNREGGLTYEVETKQTRESYLLSSRFVARQQEFAAVMEHVEQSLSGKNDGKTALFVAGVSGIGKSRLLREVRHHLQLSHRSFVETNCYEGSLSEFAPIVEAVRHVVALLESRGDGKVSAYGPDLATLDPQLAQEKGWKPAAASDNPEAERRRVIQRVAEFLLEAAGDEGVTLYVNDLQWALPATVDILAYLLRRLASRRESGEAVRFCLLGSYREDEVEGTPAERLLDELRKQERCTEIVLTPLTAEHVGVLLGSMLGIESLPKAFVKSMHAESGGNPYFIEELMRMLVESGHVFIEDGQWAAKEGTTLSQLPHTMADALIKRFALLDQGHRNLVELMAVHAQPMPVKALHAITGGELYSLQRMLNTLVHRRMAVLLPERESSYRVAHDRLRESAHDAMSVERRKELHGVLMRALAAVYAGKEDEVIYDLARHAWEAGDMEHALEYSLRAGEKAGREYANDLGITLFRRVLELLPESTRNETRLHALEKLGEMSFLTGGYDEALECYGEVIAEVEDTLTQARLRRKQALVQLARGRLDSALEKLWDAAELLGGARPKTRRQFAWIFGKNLVVHFVYRMAPFLVRPERDAQVRAVLSERVAVYVRIAYTYYFTDPISMVLCTLIFANASERLGDSPELCHAYSTLGVIYATLCRRRGARHYGEAAIAMGKRLGLAWYLGQARNFRGMGLFLMAQLEEALIFLEQARGIFLGCGDLFELNVSYLHISYCHLFRGRYNAALSASEEGVKLLHEADALQTGKIVRIHVAMAKAKLGMLEGVRAEMEETVRMCEEANDWLDLVAFRVFFGDMLLIAGSADDAIQCLNMARQVKEKHGILQDYAVGVYAYLVRAHWEKYLCARRESDLMMSARERKLLRALSRKAILLARVGHPNHLSQGHVSRGLSLWADGRVGAAKRHFRRAFEIARNQGANMWLAESLYEAGRCLNLLPKTRMEGMEYLRHAEKLFAEQGYLIYLERTREILRAEGVGV